MFDRSVTFRARQAPHAVAVTRSLSDPPGARLDVTYAQLDGSVARLAADLREEAVGGLVGVRVADPYLHWLVLLALARLGAPTVSYGRADAAATEALARPDLVVSDAADPDDARNLVHLSEARIRRVLRADAPVLHVPVPVDPDALARVVATSGTTGEPRMVPLSWSDVEARALRMATRAGPDNNLRRFLPLLDAGAGAFLLTLACWGTGGTLLSVPPRSDVVAGALTSLAPTRLLASPVQLAAVLSALPPDFVPSRDLNVTVSGSHVPPALRREARARLSQDVLVVYASTEAGTVAQAPAALLGDDATACGWTVPGCEAEVVDDADLPVPHGTVGRLRLRGPEVARGYLDDDRSPQFEGGWFRPGDLASLSADGMLRIEGRVDDLLNLGGVKVSPRLLEEAAAAVPGVVESVAVALPGPAGHDVPWLVVVRGEGLDPDALAAAVRSRVAGADALRLAWADRIPRNASGKVLRPEVRASVATASRA